MGYGELLALQKKEIFFVIIDYILLVLLVSNLSWSISSLIKSFPKGLSTYISSSKNPSKEGTSPDVLVSSILIPEAGGKGGSFIFSGRSLKISETGLFGNI